MGNTRWQKNIKTHFSIRKENDRHVTYVKRPLENQHVIYSGGLESWSSISQGKMVAEASKSRCHPAIFEVFLRSFHQTPLTHFACPHKQTLLENVYRWFPLAVVSCWGTTGSHGCNEIGLGLLNVDLPVAFGLNHDSDWEMLPWVSIGLQKLHSSPRELCHSVFSLDAVVCFFCECRSIM